MPSDLEIKQRIMDTAVEMFMKLGISKITMDELADELGMSKKTLYKFFVSKEALVSEILCSKMDESESFCRHMYTSDDEDFVLRLKKLMTFIGMQYAKWTPQFIEDMRKNHPEVWKKLSEWRQNVIMKDFGNFLREGIRKGVFRDDVNDSIFVLLYVGAIQFVVNPAVLAEYSFSASDAFETIIKVMFEGMFTEEARTKYILMPTPELIPLH